MLAARHLTTLVAIVLCSHGAAGMARELHIEHVTIISPERPAALPDASIRIVDERIVAITQGRLPGDGTSKVETLDGKGLYVIPGLIDSHVHTSDPPGIDGAHAPADQEVIEAISRQTPRSYLYFGYTTLIDLISTPERVAAWNTDEAHPDLYFCGGAQVPGGYPAIQFVSADDRRSLNRYMLVERGAEGKAPKGMIPSEHTPEAVVARMKRDGALCVKTFYERGFGEVDDFPVPNLATIRDLVKAAHAAHLPVLIHANGTDAQEFAVKAGVDIIAHGLWHWNREQQATQLTPRAQGILDSVLKANIGWQPTMQVLYGLRDVFDPDYLADPAFAQVMPAAAIEWYRSPPGQWFHDSLAPALMSKQVADSHDPRAQWNATRESLAPPILRDKNATHYMAMNNGRLLFGTDTPSAPTYANPPGLNGFREMQRMLDADMTLRQIFRAATLSNAEALGLDRELGTIEAGKRANLVLLRADPTQTLEAYNEIVKVVLHGRVLDRDALAADHAN